MRTWYKRSGSAVAALLALGAVLIGGCGDSTGLERRYPVSGTVTYKGTPLEKGSIEFRPADAANGRPAAGTIANGKYRLTTATEDDGALPGKYGVAISSVEIDDAEILKNAGGGAGHQDDIAKADASAKHLIPPKYNLADTSGLTAEVKSQTNTFDFDLKDQ